MLSFALLLAIVTFCSDLTASANNAAAVLPASKQATVLHKKFTKRDVSTEAGGEESLTLAKLLIARPCAALEQGHGQGGLSRLCLDNDNSRQQTLESDELLGLTSDDTQQNYVPANKKWLTPDFASVHKKWLTPDFASVHKKWLTPDFASVHKKWLSPDFVQIKRKRRDAGSVKKF